MTYYDRRISRRLLHELREGAFSWLLEAARRPYCDLELRGFPEAVSRECRATLYVGLTKVLDVHEDNGRFWLEASDSAKEWSGNLGDWPSWESRHEATFFQSARVREYTVCAIANVPPEYIDQEGQFQAHLCSGEFTRYTVIDREARIGGVTQAIKLPLRRPYADLLNVLATANPALGKAHSLGDQLDILATDPLGRLLVIEVKPGTKVNGLRWSPAQVSFYARLFRTWATEHGDAAAVEVLNGMLAQREHLGLNRAAAMVASPLRIVPVIAVTAPVQKEGLDHLHIVRKALAAGEETAWPDLELWFATGSTLDSQDLT